MIVERGRMAVLGLRAGVEAVEVEKLGIGEEVQVAFTEADLAGELLVGGGNGVEVGEVLGDVRGATPSVTRRHVV